jgi:hypothetical protein
MYCNGRQFSMVIAGRIPEHGQQSSHGELQAGYRNMGNNLPMVSAGRIPEHGQQSSHGELLAGYRNNGMFSLGIKRRIAAGSVRVNF